MNVNKLGKFFLQEIDVDVDVDVDEVSKEGTNLLFLVASHGNLQMIKSSLRINSDNKLLFKRKNIQTQSE